MLAALPGRDRLPAPALAKAAGVGAGVVQTMARDGLLDAVPLTRPADLAAARIPSAAGVELTPAQAAAAAELCRLVAAGGGVALLDGVPGAGKTEVYFEAVAAALRAGPARAGPAARDRALGPVAGPVRAPVRDAARRLALGAHLGAAAARPGG